MCWVNTGGGQLPYSKYFANIRKQLIWGNKYIKVKGQSLRFNNWIESNLIYINDLLVEKEKISQEIKGILSTSCVIFSCPKLLSISVLTFIK
jgi:hypothetical protein